jgi:abortive infection bacteriophage resistance protein
MADKIFKTLDEQIEILKSKNLIINDVDKAKDVLFRENYFFINGYRRLFSPITKRFENGTTFEELYATFSFDRNIRNIMFKNILIVENNIKSIMSYQLSKKYGYKQSDYLKEANFDQDPLKVRQVRDVLRKMERQIRSNSKHHLATSHYSNKYGYIPMWVVVKVLSMGIIAEFYNILKSEDQNVINDYYKIDTDTMYIYLQMLSNFRNMCAHEDILYDYRPQKQIPNTLCHKLLDIPMIEGEYIYGKNDLFSLVIVLKQLLTDSEFVELKNEISYEIDILDGKIDSVSLDDILNRMGFPSNWKLIGKIF